MPYRQLDLLRNLIKNSLYYEEINQQSKMTSVELATRVLGFNDVAHKAMPVRVYAENRFFIVKAISDPVALIEITSILRRLNKHSGIKCVFLYSLIKDDPTPGYCIQRFTKIGNNQWVRSELIQNRKLPREMIITS